MEQEVATQVVGLGGATDFSLIQLFLRADFIVKSVIIIFKLRRKYEQACRSLYSSISRRGFFND